MRVTLLSDRDVEHAAQRGRGWSKVAGLVRHKAGTAVLTPSSRLVCPQAGPVSFVNKKHREVTLSALFPDNFS